MGKPVGIFTVISQFHPTCEINKNFMHTKTTQLGYQYTSHLVNTLVMICSRYYELASVGVVW